MKSGAHPWLMVDAFIKASSLTIPGMGSIHKAQNRHVPKEPQAYTTPHVSQATSRTESVQAQKQVPPPPVQ